MPWLYTFNVTPQPRENREKKKPMFQNGVVLAILTADAQLQTRRRFEAWAYFSLCRGVTFGG